VLVMFTHGLARFSMHGLPTSRASKKRPYCHTDSLCFSVYTLSCVETAVGEFRLAPRSKLINTQIEFCPNDASKSSTISEVKVLVVSGWLLKRSETVAYQ